MPAHIHHRALLTLIALRIVRLPLLIGIQRLGPKVHFMLQLPLPIRHDMPLVCSLLRLGLAGSAWFCP